MPYFNFRQYCLIVRQIVLLIRDFIIIFTYYQKGQIAIDLKFLYSINDNFIIDWLY